MVTAWSNQGNGQRANKAVYYLLLTTTIVAAYLVTPGNCLPTSKEEKSHSDGRALLSSAISEFEDALSRLKQYVKSLTETGVRSTDQEADEDPFAESVERESREDEDYRQEPEIAPGLSRFEKNLDEAAGSSGKKAVQKSGAISSHDQSFDKDALNDISLQDLLNFVRETVKDRKKEGESKGNEHFVRSTTKLTTLSTADEKSKDISLKDLMEFLKERNSQKSKDHTGLATQDAPSERRDASEEDKTKTAVRDDSSNVSLKDALEYLAALKNKLNQNERTE